MGSCFSAFCSTYCAMLRFCHREHPAKPVTLKHSCLQLDPTVFSGQRRSRISLRHPLLLTLSHSLSLSLFFFLLLWLMIKKRKKMNQQHTNTHPPSLLVLAERISCPSAVWTGSPSVKTNMVHSLKKRALTWEGRRSTWTHHDMNASISWWISIVLLLCIKLKVNSFTATKNFFFIFILQQQQQKNNTPCVDVGV